MNTYSTLNIPKNSPQQLIRPVSPAGNVLRTSYTPIQNQPKSYQYQQYTPQGLKMSQQHSMNRLTPTIQVLTPEKVQRNSQVPQLNQSKQLINQCDVSYISQNKMMRQSNASFHSQNTRHKAGNSSMIEQPYPTTILQTQQIIHHTYYPVPVERDQFELTQTEKKNTSFFTHHDEQLYTPATQSKDKNQEFIDQKIQLLLLKIADLNEENNQLKLDADRRGSNQQYENLQQAYKKQEQETSKLYKENEMLKAKLVTPSPKKQTIKYQDQQFMNDEFEKESVRQQMSQIMSGQAQSSSQIQPTGQGYSIQQVQPTGQGQFTVQGQPQRKTNDDIELKNLKKEIELLKQQQVYLQNKLQNQSVGYDQDKQFIEELTNENSKLKQMLGQQEDKFKQFQQIIKDNQNRFINKINKSSQESNRLKEENEKLKTQYRETLIKLKNLEFKSDIDINSLKFKVQSLETERGKQNGTEDRIKTLEAEVSEWKGKFVRLNREYHINQERLVLTLAEMDAVRKRFQPNNINQDRLSAFEGELKNFQARLSTNAEGRVDDI